MAAATLLEASSFPRDPCLLVSREASYHTTLSSEQSNACMGSDETEVQQVYNVCESSFSLSVCQITDSVSRITIRLTESLIWQSVHNRSKLAPFDSSIN